jgi:hypothetical protein
MLPIGAISVGVAGAAAFDGHACQCKPGAHTRWVGDLASDGKRALLQLASVGVAGTPALYLLLLLLVVVSCREHAFTTHPRADHVCTSDAHAAGNASADAVVTVAAAAAEQRTSCQCASK